MDTPVKIFSGRATLPLAKEIARVTVFFGNIIISKFSDGEFIPSLKKQLGAQKFYHSVYTPPSDNLMELLLMIDAASGLRLNKLLLLCLISVWRDKIAKTSLEYQ